MPHIRNNGLHGRPKFNQARKIIARFKNESTLARLLGISRISVYRWQYSRPYGSDGLIPSAQIEKIRAIARKEGVLLRNEDWVPERLHWEEGSNLPTIDASRLSPKHRANMADLLD